MSQSYIINAAPMVIERGTQDLSTRQLPQDPEALPQHLPKFYVYAQKGPATPQLAVGAGRQDLYGTDTFDLRKKYANHATAFSNLVNAEGNTCMYERIIPDDAGPESNLLLSIEILETQVDPYLRDDKGNIIYYFNAETNKLVPTASTESVTGYQARWLVSSNTNATTAADFGVANIVTGTWTDGTNLSKIYPILELKVSNKGEYGNNSGINIWAPNTLSPSGFNTRLMIAEKAYPFKIGMIRRPDANSTPVGVHSIMGDPDLTFMFKPGAIDPTYDSQVFIGDILLDAYQNLTDPKYPTVYGDFGRMALYSSNLNTVSSLVATAESAYLNSKYTVANGLDQFTDFTVNGTFDAAVLDAEKLLANIVSAQSSNGFAYYTLQIVSNPAGVPKVPVGVTISEVALGQLSNIYAAGGSDGTMSDDLFAVCVGNKVTEYANNDSQLQDLAVNVESILYDSGFPLPVKKQLASFIAQRKDTFVALSTYEVNTFESGMPLANAAEEHSTAIALRTFLQFYPESDYYGTPVMRGMIIGRSGILRNSQFTKRLPMMTEVAIKSARYMGAANGRWKSGYNFDGAPGSVVDYMSDVSIVFTPATTRNKDWDVGLNWVQSYDRRSVFFPALKTVYTDDTSVLNSYFTALAIGQLNKIAHAAWREFSGVSSLSNAELCRKVNSFVSNKTQDIFDGRYVIKPNATITDMDDLRGFSWTLPISIYANNMKTVMTTSVQAYRMSDLVTA